MTLTVLQAAKLLGVSRAMVYKLAAPHGPIPCTRIGTRIIFEEADVQQYKESCRVVQRVHPAPQLLGKTHVALPPDGESSLIKTFRKLGLEPRLWQGRTND